jgi:hypothetical protein
MEPLGIPPSDNIGPQGKRFNSQLCRHLPVPNRGYSADGARDAAIARVRFDVRAAK